MDGGHSGPGCSDPRKLWAELWQIYTIHSILVQIDIAFVI